MASCIVLCIIAISGVGEYTVLTDKLPDSGDDGFEVSLLLGSLLASYSDVISLWEDVAVSQSELLLNCYCNQKIFHFGRVLRILCSHSLPRCWIGFLFGVDVPQVCLHHCESRPHWSWYQSLSLRIFLFGRALRSGKLHFFLQYFWFIVLFISLWEGVSYWE